MRSDPFPQKKLRTPYSNLHGYEDPEVPEVHIVVEPDGGGGMTEGRCNAVRGRPDPSAASARHNLMLDRRQHFYMATCGRC